MWWGTKAKSTASFSIRLCASPYVLSMMFTWTPGWLRTNAPRGFASRSATMLDGAAMAMEPELSPRRDSTWRNRSS